MKNIIKVSILPILGLLVFAGCAKHKNVLVNSYCNTANTNCISPESTFNIIPVTDSSLKGNLLNNNKFLENEVNRKIEVMLINKGYKVVYDEKADYMISYGCYMNKYSVKENVPVYLPGTGYYTSGYIGKNSYSSSTYGGGSYKIVEQENTYFSKDLLCIIYKNGKTDGALWQGYANVHNRNFDYRSDIDYLIKGVFSVFGINSKKTVNKRIECKDKEIKLLQSI